MNAHACPPLAPCLSCLDAVLSETVLRDDEEDAIDAALERARDDIAEEDRYACDPSNRWRF